MPGNDDKKNGGFGPIPNFNPPEVERNGNADAKILAKAFEEYAKDGLTAEERARIEKIGAVLKTAAIVISPDGKTAAIAENDGKTFTLTAKGRSK